MNFKPRGNQPLSTITISSRFKYGDSVVVYFGTAGIIQNCKVIKIHSTESKISYDVEVKWKHIESADKVSAGVDKERELTDRLYNLGSAVVFSPDDFEETEPQKELFEKIEEFADDILLADPSNLAAKSILALVKN